MKSKNKKLVLGTALWGWGVSKEDAFSMLDHFVKLGGYYIDCATNYPINKNIEDYGLALKWLEEWNKINNKKLFIIVKIGSLDNLGSPSFDISRERILSIYENLFDMFGESLGCISVHWDNRTQENDMDEIKATLIALKEIKMKGISIGLSGIKEPSIYYNAMPELSDNWIIQCKENLLTNESRLSYYEYFPLASYFAYGINMGGLKISKDDKSISAHIRKINYSDSLKSLILKSLDSEMLKSFGLKSVNDLSMAFIYANDIYDGIIIGPRTNEQLESTFRTWDKLSKLELKNLELLREDIQRLNKRINKLD